jgi:hypothetical protein
MKQISKKIMFVIFFAIFLQGSTLFSETNGQAANRARNLSNEWNYLAGMVNSLNGKSYINLVNYMMGFAEGAYRLCEDLNNLGIWDFFDDANFFFEKYQLLAQRDETTKASFYYLIGGQRAQEGKGNRMGINDF